MTTTALPSGFYVIKVVGGGEPKYLTCERGNATILTPNGEPGPDQEWRIIRAKDGNIIIERPSPIIPGTYLTYQGAGEKPQEGERILCRVSEFPPNEWHVVSGNIRVAGSDLGIRVAPPKIFPPFLELGLEDQLEWEFIPVLVE